MTDKDYEEIGRLLREAYAKDDAGLQRDLWPAMLRRIESRTVRVPWYDWALAAGSLALLIMLPGFLVILAYHI
jgi:hypothetical protein